MVPFQPACQLLGALANRCIFELTMVILHVWGLPIIMQRAACGTTSVTPIQASTHADMERIRVETSEAYEREARLLRELRDQAQEEAARTKGALADLQVEWTGQRLLCRLHAMLGNKMRIGIQGGLEHMKNSCHCICCEGPNGRHRACFWPCPDAWRQERLPVGRP
jgi:hypothetical protein